MFVGVMAQQDPVTKLTTKIQGYEFFCFESTTLYYSPRTTVTNVTSSP